MSTDPKSTYYDHGGIETVEILRAKLFPEQLEGYLLGNIIKYASRLNYKGDPQRDSEKLVIYATLLRDVMREHDQNASETRDPQLHDGEPIDASGQEQVRERHDIVPAGWLPISTAPTDGTEVEVLTEEREGLLPIHALASYHPDAGWTVDELRRTLYWRPLYDQRPPDRHSTAHCPDGGACKRKCGLEPCKAQS